MRNSLQNLTKNCWLKINNVWKINYRISFLLFFLLLFLPAVCRAMPPGTLLYRTSNDGRMFGYSDDPLLGIEKGIVKQVNSGHAAIYVGKIDGIDYIVEALGGGIVKTPAQYFVNSALGEKLVGARIPRGLDSLQQAKVVALAKSLVGKGLDYDFDFKKQKGPESGEWTCVGLTEKIYESANISNPNNLGALEYDSNYYAFDITPDGYDNKNVVNSEGDCFSENYEFSKIARRTNMLFPAPELIGYDVGLEYEGDRYIFLPYTQFLQPSLDDVEVDVSLAVDFNDEAVRGKVSSTKLALRWSLINNPLSSLKAIAAKVTEVALNLKDKIFKNNETAIVLNDDISSVAKTNPVPKTTAKTTAASTKKTTTAKTTASKTSPTNAAKPVAVKSAPVSKTPVSDGAKTAVTGKTVTSAKTATSNKVASSSVSAKKITTAKTTTPKTTTTSQTVARLVNTNPSVTTTDSNSNNSVSVNIASNQSNGQNVNLNTGTASATSTETEPVDINESNEPSDWLKLAMIKRIYSTGDNDWVELFNPTDHDFDLKTAEYRLEKTKAAVAPSLLMRIGNEDDGSYPGGTLIKAHDSYLIVREDANDFYKNQADALANRSEFTWPGSGYTLYLGNGAISSSTDANIIDAVGFGGDATYFLGSGPAPEIIDNYVLTKISSSSDNLNNNNALDFTLVLSDEPGLIATSSEINTETSTSTSTSEVITPNWEAFLAPTPIDSADLGDLWHFDECYGNNIKWGVGKWGCALELNYLNSNLTATLTPAYDLDNFSLSFNYKRKENSRIIVELSNSFNEKIDLQIEHGMVQIGGLPESDWRYYQDYVNDDLWHQAILVINRVDHYWALYIDGQEKIKETFGAALPEMEKLKIWTSQGYTLLDEFALWHRALSAEEIVKNYNDQAPFSPVNPREAQIAPILKHFWHFDEGHVSTSLDYISGLDLDIPEGIWNSSGRLNTALVSRSGKNLAIDLDNSLQGKDYSLSLWWRNSVYPGEGRTYISLRKDNQPLFGFLPDYYRNSYWFNNNYGIFHEGLGDLIPGDNLWHYLVLTYDSYRYSLNFYVDGEEKASSSFVWLEDGNEPDRLEIISNSDYSDIDELGIWQGALSPGQIKTLFDDTPEFE